MNINELILDSEKTERNVFDFEATAEEMREAVEARNAVIAQMRLNALHS